MPWPSAHLGRGQTAHGRGFIFQGLTCPVTCQLLLFPGFLDLELHVSFVKKNKLFILRTVWFLAMFWKTHHFLGKKNWFKTQTKPKSLDETSVLTCTARSARMAACRARRAKPWEMVAHFVSVSYQMLSVIFVGQNQYIKNQCKTNIKKTLKTTGETSNFVCRTSHFPMLAKERLP